MQFRNLSKRTVGFAIVGTLFLFCAGVWVAVLAETPRGVLTVAVLNIGQGDSIYIESPTGLRVLLDGGPDSSVLRELSKVMPLFSHSVDAVIESHPDSDHIAGLVDVLARYHVGAFIEPGIIKHNATTDALEGELTSEKVSRYIARRGMTIDLGGGAQLDILYPNSDVSRIPEAKDNEGVIVARLVYGNTSVMLTADSPKDVEQKLIALDGAGLQSTLLKVCHHGSKSCSGSAFIAAVHPSVALISVGANNKYGHPNQETLDTFALQNIPVLRTDKDSTIVFRSDGEKFVRVQ